MHEYISRLYDWFYKENQVFNYNFYQYILSNKI